MVPVSDARASLRGTDKSTGMQFVIWLTEATCEVSDVVDRASVPVSDSRAPWRETDKSSVCEVADLLACAEASSEPLSSNWESTGVDSDVVSVLTARYTVQRK